MALKMIATVRRHLRNAICRMKSPERIFTEIYRGNRWGGRRGEICSGGGSSDERVVGEYLRVLSENAGSHGFATMQFVDLGCGDMNVGRRLIPLCRSYVGADVVKYVVENNRATIDQPNAEFVHCDIVSDQLPDGDVCFLRQVLQHLSNDQIRRILPKLAKYRFVYITEHVPRDWGDTPPNLDKPAGAGIRLDQGSGIDITREPFGISTAEVEEVLEVVANPNSSGLDPGVIRTVLYRPKPNRETAHG